MIKQVKKRKYKTIFDMQEPQTGPEMKYMDLVQQITNFSAPAFPPPPVYMNLIGQGTAYWERIGSKVNMQAVHIRGYIDNVQTGAGIPGLMRMIVFYDRQPNGAACVYSDVIQGRTNAGVASVDGLTGLNIDNRQRFVIIYDKYMYAAGYNAGPPVVMEGNNTTGKDGNNEYIFNCYIPLRNLVSIFKSSTLTIADISTGALGVFFVDSNETNKRRAIWTSRLCYYDE